MLIGPFFYLLLNFHSQDATAAKIFADEAANILERAINGSMSRNALLYYAYADFEEGRMKYEKVHQMYNKFLSIPDVDPTLVRCLSIIWISRFRIGDGQTKFSSFHPSHLDLCAVHEIRPSR